MTGCTDTVTFPLRYLSDCEGIAPHPLSPSTPFLSVCTVSLLSPTEDCTPTCSSTTCTITGSPDTEDGSAALACAVCTSCVPPHLAGLVGCADSGTHPPSCPTSVSWLMLGLGICALSVLPTLGGPPSLFISWSARGRDSLSVLSWEGLGVYLLALQLPSFSALPGLAPPCWAGLCCEDHT